MRYNQSTFDEGEWEEKRMTTQCLKNFPVTLFASVMGITGLSIAYLRYSSIHNFVYGVGIGLLALAIFIFLFISVVYGAKYIRHRDEVLKEFHHPIKANFFPAISISLMLLAVALYDFHFLFSALLWGLGSLLQLVLTITLISRWITRSYEITHSNPTWFIPVVGNIIVPIAGVDFVDKEILWFFFSIGLFFWISLFSIIFYRLIFHPQIAQKFVPTLFILIAPPALGFISYIRLTGDMDIAARILLYLALFFVLLLLSMVKYFTQLTFSVSWWAYTFPLCGVTIASIMATRLLSSTIMTTIASALILLTSCVIAIVFTKTVIALCNKSLCEEE